MHAVDHENLVRLAALLLRQAECCRDRELRSEMLQLIDRLLDVAAKLTLSRIAGTRHWYFWYRRQDWHGGDSSNRRFDRV